MKNQLVYMRIKQQWFCISYPPFTSVKDVELGVRRAKAMLMLHGMASRVFYIEGPSRTYNNIKSDGVLEYPEPRRLRDLFEHTPEYLLEEVLKK